MTAAWENAEVVKFLLSIMNRKNVLMLEGMKGKVAARSYDKFFNVNWQEFFDWYHEILEADYEYEGHKIEGFVIEDSAGYMTKIKLT